MTQKVEFQLYDQHGKAITSSGGVVYVAAATGDPTAATLTNKAGTSQSNPFALTNGAAEFYVANTVTSMDLFIDCPDGEFVVAKAVAPGAMPDIVVDKSVRHHCMVIPFAQAAFDANTETDTGFDEPTNAIILPDVAIRVSTIDATETISIGTDSGDSGDADGFAVTLALGTAGVVKATIAQSGNTLGALFEVQDSANSGDLTHEGHVSGGKSITITTSAGSDTGEGYIYLPYLLCN